MANEGQTEDPLFAAARDFRLPDMPTIGPESLVDAKISLLLKGHQGSGKTHTALSFPQPIFLAYADPNRETVRQHLTQHSMIVGNRIESWAGFSNTFVPKVLNREIPARTVVVDTIDFAADLMWKALQSGRSKLTIQDFGTGLTRLSEATLALTGATTPKGEHPGYHVVFCVHLKDITDEAGAMLRTVPQIMGQFANKLESYFDYVLLCTSSEGTKQIVVDGRQQLVRSKTFQLHSIGPDKYNTCKGGGLPAEIVIEEGESGFEKLNEYWKL